MSINHPLRGPGTSGIYIFLDLPLVLVQPCLRQPGSSPCFPNSPRQISKNRPRSSLQPLVRENAAPAPLGSLFKNRRTLARGRGDALGHGAEWGATRHHHIQCGHHGTIAQQAVEGGAAKFSVKTREWPPQIVCFAYICVLIPRASNARLPFSFKPAQRQTCCRVGKSKQIGMGAPYIYVGFQRHPTPCSKDTHSANLWSGCGAHRGNVGCKDLSGCDLLHERHLCLPLGAISAGVKKSAMAMAIYALDAFGFIVVE